jgi:DNA-binding YbaB/EbfC family protein
MDHNDMLKKLQNAQNDMQYEIKKIENTEYEGISSGVKITILGNKKVFDIQIQSALYQDPELLKECLIIAFNDGTKKVDEALTQIAPKLTDIIF